VKRGVGSEERIYPPNSTRALGNAVKSPSSQGCVHLTSSETSAYRADHSTETAKLKVLTDILLAVDAGDLSALVLLDLSAAFDTVDHGIFLHRLDSFYQIVGSVQQWFLSYLSNQLQYVRVTSSPSSPGSMCVVYPRVPS